MNFVKGKVAGPTQVECALGTVTVRVPEGMAAASPVTLAIRPEHVRLGAADHGSPGLTGNIVTKNYLGDAALLEVEVNGVTFLVKLPGDCEFTVGQKAAVELPAERWRVFRN
jgi:ABC-type sugar transport system ATPase subunit